MKNDTLPWFLTVIVTVIALDRLTKIAAIYYLEGKSSYAVFPFLYMTYTTNAGASFGLLQGFPWIPFVVGVAVVALISFYYRSIPAHWIPQHSAALIVGGAIGNLWDRMVYGTVIDFIDVRVWPIFNIADSAITIGGILAAYWFLHLERSKKE